MFRKKDKNPDATPKKKSGFLKKFLIGFCIFVFVMPILSGISTSLMYHMIGSAAADSSDTWTLAEVLDDGTLRLKNKDSYTLVRLYGINADNDAVKQYIGRTYRLEFDGKAGKYYSEDIRQCYLIDAKSDRILQLELLANGNASVDGSIHPQATYYDDYMYAAVNGRYPK